MQTLGLASENKPTDGMFKRLFWPTIENQYDLDLVSQQGFWVCFVIGILSFIVLLAAGQWFIGLLVALTYVLGATGVRERSVAAAVLIFSCYTIDRLSGFFVGQPPIGIFPITAFLLLFSNVRATILAHRWKSTGTDEQTEVIERSDTSFADKLANVLPPTVWPSAKFVFFPMAGLLLVLTVVGVAMFPSIQRHRAEQLLQHREDQIIAVKPAD